MAPLIYGTVFSLILSYSLPVIINFPVLDLGKLGVIHEYMQVICKDVYIYIFIISYMSNG